MSTLAELLLGQHDNIDVQATKILDYFYSIGFSSMNSNELIDALRSDYVSTKENWNDFLDSGNFIARPPRIIASGSWSEKLETLTQMDNNFIRELDFMFVIGRASQDQNVLIHKKSAKPAFYYIQVHKSHTVSNRFKETLCETRDKMLFLSPIKVMKHVENIIRNTFSKGQIKKSSITDEADKFMNSPVITLKYCFQQLQTAYKRYNKLNVMMDIAPVFETQLRLPEIDIPFLSDFQKADVLAQPVLLVAKSSDDLLQWRASSSLAERKLFYHLKAYVTVPAILRTAKQVHAMLLPWKTGIKSYHLKTTLLHWLCEDQGQHKVRWCLENIADYVCELFVRLCSYIEKGTMQHLFFEKLICSMP